MLVCLSFRSISKKKPQWHRPTFDQWFHHQAVFLQLRTTWKAGGCSCSLMSHLDCGDCRIGATFGIYRSTGNLYKFILKGYTGIKKGSANCVKVVRLEICHMMSWCHYRSQWIFDKSDGQRCQGWITPVWYSVVRCRWQSSPVKLAWRRTCCGLPDQALEIEMGYTWVYLSPKRSQKCKIFLGKAGMNH